MYSVKNAARRLKREGNIWYAQATSDDIWDAVVRHVMPRQVRAYVTNPFVAAKDSDGNQIKPDLNSDYPVRNYYFNRNFYQDKLT